jgi:hypothetical protein
MSLSSRILFIGNSDQSRLGHVVVVYRQIVTKFELPRVTIHWKFQLRSKKLWL